MNDLTLEKFPTVSNRFMTKRAEIDFGIGRLIPVTGKDIQELKELVDGVEIDLDEELPDDKMTEIIFPAQCECGHLYLEKYKWEEPQNDKGLIGFCWCGFCRTRRNVYINQSEEDPND